MSGAILRRRSGWRDSDLWYSFTHSPVAVGSATAALVFILGAGFAPWLAPHNPFNIASLSLLDSFRHPFASWAYPLGSDEQGRDMLSAIMFGMRVSLLVGAASVAFALVAGVAVGLIAGYAGGWLDGLLMRTADVQLTFPSILMALLIDGVVGALLPRDQNASVQLYVIVFAIGISRWPQFARIVRGSTLVERGKDYVAAAQVIGIGRVRILLSHILPNVLGPVLVIGTLTLGISILDEATLSFLGVGLPPTQPSLGTLIRIGDDFLFSGQWWVTVFPGLALMALVLAINLLGDWLRDALNPRLR